MDTWSYSEDKSWAFDSYILLAKRQFKVWTHGRENQIRHGIFGTRFVQV